MNQNSLKWQIELIAFLITAIVVVLFMWPIFSETPSFPYLIYNIISIVVLITLVRYIFLLRFTPFSKYAPVKVVLLFLAIPLIVYLIDGLSEFYNQLDEEGAYSMVSEAVIERQMPLANYIKSEMLFFGVGAIITTAILPIRMIVSIWRVRNRNTV